MVLKIFEKGVRPLLIGCYKCVTVVLHTQYKGLEGILQICYRDVTKMLQVSQGCCARCVCRVTFQR